MKHAMIDLETLGTKPGCKIASIGACLFGPEGVDYKSTFHHRIHLMTSPGIIEPATVLWWMEQSAAAREELRGDDHFDIAVTDQNFGFVSWWRESGATTIWAAPVHFDVPILEAAMGYRRVPWTHRDVRDARTVYSITGIWPDRTVGEAHNALDDATNQAEALVKALNKIGWPVE